MIATVPLTESVTLTSLDYLLLGDLRGLLEEPFTADNRRWLLTILDRLILSQAIASTPPPFRSGRLWATRSLPPALPPELSVQLRRLRDQVAHGTATENLVQAVRLALTSVLTSPVLTDMAVSQAVAG